MEESPFLIGNLPDLDWFAQVPKVEIHLHLEGAIPLETLWELAKKYGGDPQVPDLVALERLFVFRDFPHFLETWHWKNGFIREYEDFTFLAESVARDLARQKVRYVEAFCSPPDFYARGLQAQSIIEAVRAGLDRVPEVEVALVVDLVRDGGPERAWTTLQQIAEVREYGVIGVGIGGAEHSFPPEPFAPVYVEARRLGFHTTAHAGEAAGPESIWGALRRLEAERIGHGTRAVEDPRLVEYLAETQLPVEMCPLSNVRTGVVRGLEEHPIRQFFDRGLRVSVNTDDPKMFGSSLAEEYALLETKLGFSRQDVRQLILNGIASTWLPQERKRQLVAEFTADPCWNIQ